MNADVLIRSAGNFSAAGKSNSSAYGLKFTNRSIPTDRGVVIGEANHIKTSDRRRVHQLGWGQSAVTAIRMCVYIDLQALPLSTRSTTEKISGKDDKMRKWLPSECCPKPGWAC